MVQPRVPGIDYAVGEDRIREDVIKQSQARIDDRVKVLVQKGKSEGEARKQAESEIKEYIDKEVDRRMKWDCQEYASSPCHSGDIE
jgi:hypothetical protein